MTYSSLRLFAGPTFPPQRPLAEFVSQIIPVLPYAVPDRFHIHRDKGMTVAGSGDLLLVTDVSFGSAIVDFDTPIIV